MAIFGSAASALSVFQFVIVRFLYARHWADICLFACTFILLFALFTDKYIIIIIIIIIKVKKQI